MPVLHGSRLCGGVKYEVAGPLICLNTRGGRRPSNDRVLPLDQADRVETVFAAASGLSIQLEVLSEFSEPRNSLKKDLSNVAHSAMPRLEREALGHGF
jgi:hypothetical protein